MAAFASLGLCAIITLALLMIALASGPAWQRALSSLPALALLLFIYRVWPRRIVLGERGVWQYTLLGRQDYMIPWTELAEAAPGVELAWLSSKSRSGFASNDTIVLASTKLPLRIIHTPRHSDRERFLAVTRQRIAKPPALAT